MELQSFRDPQEYQQIKMPQSKSHWNLTETAAWVVFRTLSVVERFSGPSPDHWQAYIMYDSMWVCPKFTEPSELGLVFDRHFVNQEKPRLKLEA